VILLATNRGGTVVDRHEETAAAECFEWMAQQKAQGRILHRVSVEEAETIRNGARYVPEKHKG
jgi:hypothetical protein